MSRIPPGWRRAARWSGWAVTAMSGFLVLMNLFGVSPISTIWAVQAFSPFVMLATVAAAVWASFGRRHGLALVAAGLAVPWMWLSAPLVFHGNPPPPANGTPRITVAFANIFNGNDRPEDAARTLLAQGADLVGVAELTVPNAGVFVSAGFASGWGQMRHVAWDRQGIALYSRYSIISASTDRLGNQYAVVAVLDVGGQPVRVIVFHPLAGTDDGSLDSWRHDLETLGDLLRQPGPTTLVIGDFNASWWHPAFRDLLERTGYHDVATWLGHGFDFSWPNDEPLPPFVTIDHALVRDGIVPTGFHMIDVPGSDHRGFVATFALSS